MTEKMEAYATQIAGMTSDQLHAEQIRLGQSSGNAEDMLKHAQGARRLTAQATVESIMAKQNMLFGEQAKRRQAA